MSRLERFLTRAYSARSEDLAVFRILWAAWLLAGHLPRALWTLEAPRLFFSPPLGLPSLLADPAGPTTVFVLESAAAAAALLLLVGCATRLASLATALLLLCLDSVAFAFEGPSHTVLAYAVPGLLAFSSWGDAYSADARRKRPRIPPEQDAFVLALLAFVAAAGFFWGGWVKAAHGWLDGDRLAVWGHMIRTWLVTERTPLLAPWVANVDLFAGWKLMDAATLVLELGLLPAFFFPRAFRALLAFACVFHLAVYLLMAIPFGWNVAAYGAFVPWTALAWPRAARAAAARLGRIPASLPAAAWALACLFLGFASVLATDPSPELSAFRRGADALILAGGGVLALALLAGGVRREPSARPA